MKNVVKVAVIVTVLLAGFSAQAQIFGIKAGAGISNISSPDAFDNSRFGALFATKVAGTVEFEIVDETLFIGTGAGFAKRGASTVGDPLNLYYLEFPGGVRYNIFNMGRSARFFVTSGFHLGVLALATQSGETLQIGSGNEGNQVKPLDFNFNIGPGVIFNDRFELGLLTEFGIPDIAAFEGDTLRNIAVMVTFGFKFGQ